ncbi:MAG: PQQ-binding-like beta-propeller repeat protein [Candidatus Anammoximicrobium sp.]|nr:PQQ-binding-like beta-propeller repeat protein [Candidatus Anammoximicrobium sp.]
MTTNPASRLGSLLTLALFVSGMHAADWPMYRADAGRSGYSPDPLPGQLELRWTHQAPTPRPAWPNSMRITYDFAPQAIIAGRTIVLGSTADDRVTALDAETGQPRWTFFTGGPVRFAPAAWRDRVFVGSDDGCLYALSLADGRLLWQHRGGPGVRMCLGNERLISRWPARGGPLVLDDTVYYTAGIWPSEGVYLHALDAATGDVRWTNDRTGQLYHPQPHGGANAYSGVAPQGYLLATPERILVPTGRAVPAAFRRNDGELEHYRLQDNGSMGGARAVLAERFVINGGCFLETETGALAARAGRGVFSALPDGVLQFTGTTLLAYRWADVDATDRKGRAVRYRGLKEYAEITLADAPEAVRRAEQVVQSLPGLKNLFQAEVRFKEADENVARQTGLERALAQARPDVERLGADVEPFQAAAYERTNEVIAAGHEAVCGSPERVSIVDLEQQQVRWSQAVEGRAVGLAAANGLLVVCTTSGAVYCFAAPTPAAQNSARAASAADAPAAAPAESPPAHAGDALAAQAADEILHKSGLQEGLCLDLGCGSGQLALELVRRSSLYVIGIEDDPQQVARARQRLVAAGVYGTRASIHQADPNATGCPRYIANLIVSSRRLAEASFLLNPDEIQRLQRPSGGVVCLGTRGSLEIQRRGPLDGAGQWTHQNADPANTLCSGDQLVRGPLETSWFRDSVLEIPDRHAQGPAPLFSQGHLVVEGVHGVCALDAYNGRTRWVYPIPGILADWDGVHHDVGVGDTGSNFCLSGDAVFVRTADRCLKIDLANGRKSAEFPTPVEAGAENRDWGFVAYADGLLFGSVLNRQHTVSPRYGDIRLRTESVLLFALDAATGQLRWQYRPQHSIRNNAIAVAGGRVYLIDRPLSMADRITEPKPNGKHRPLLKPGEHPGGTLLALDAGSGAVLWKTDKDVFGTQLAVSAQRGVVLMHYQGVKHNFFKLPSELGGRMAAFQTATGARIWDIAADYRTRPIINGDVIYAEGGAWKLASGESVPWTFQRSYGCGQIAASCHLLVFRSATLGYLDLTRDAGTENFGGVRTGCWFNAIPAGGLVLVPDGSFKCACSYQTQAWLALQSRE